MSKIGSYTVERFPKFRELVSESVKSGKKMNHVAGLVEVDVTETRETIRAYKEKTGEQLSFTAFVISCAARAAEENKSIQALRKRNKIILFDDVNIRCNIEKEINGKKTVVMHIIRKANEKSYKEIHEEIRSVQKGEKKKATDNSPSKKKRKGQNKLVALPKFIRKFIWRKLRKDPFFIQKNFGAIGVTPVGMFFKKRQGWAFTPSPHSVSIAIGSIAKKPGVVNDQIVIREYLSLTTLFNHDVVDGAPAARFYTRLCDLIEEGYGLDEFK